VQNGDFILHPYIPIFGEDRNVPRDIQKILEFHWEDPVPKRDFTKGCSAESISTEMDDLQFVP